MAKEIRKSIRPEGTGSDATARRGAARPAPAKTAGRPTHGDAPATITQEQIRERAYRIYVTRNGGPGDALSDWKQAEQELRTERAGRVPPAGR